MSDAIQDELEYQRAIPPWCSLKTTQEHIDHLLLCWGILYGGPQSQGIGYCRNCEIRDEWAAFREENA